MITRGRKPYETWNFTAAASRVPESDFLKSTLLFRNRTCFDLRYPFEGPSFDLIFSDTLNV